MSADLDEVHAKHRAEVVDLLFRDAEREDRVVAAASMDPLRRTLLEADFRRPELLCNRQMRRLGLSLAAVDRVADEAEAIAEIRDRTVDTVAVSAREDEAGRVVLTTDVERMDFDARFVAGNRRVDLEHVCAKDGLMALAQVERVVFHEDRAVIVGHDLQEARQGRRLPVALCAESVAIAHQELSSEARQLLEALEVLEVRREGRVALVIEELLDAEVLAQLIADRALEFLRAVLLRVERVQILEFLVLGVDVRLADTIDDFDEIADRPVVDRPAELDLRLDLIALRDSYIAHRIAEAADLDAEALVVGDGDVFPRSDLILDFFIAPPAVDNLVVETEASIEVAVLAITVCALIEVHVVEVDRVVRNLVEVLRREVQQRLLQELRAANPVLRRGERVHPGDDACDIVVVVDLLHELRDTVSRRHDAL